MQKRTATNNILSILVAHPIVVIGIIYLITVFLLPRDYFWIADNDNKFLLTKAFIASDYSEYSIPWPGEVIDPGFDFNPLPAPFSQVSDGKLYSIFSPVFATVSSIPFTLFGYWGLYLLPISGSLITLLGIARLLRSSGYSDRIVASAVFIAGMATPIWFYSVLFWEHMVAVAFCVWAVYALVRYLETGVNRYLLWMSVLAAAGVYFRDELYLFCVALTGTVILMTPSKQTRWNILMRIAGVMVCALIPLWLFQWWAIDQPFGFHLGAHLFSANGIAAHIAARPQVVYNLLCAIHPNILISVLITIPWFILFFIPARYYGRYGRYVTALVVFDGLLLMVVAITGYMTSESPIVWLLKSNSIFSVSPFLVLAAIPYGKNAPLMHRCIRMITIFFLAVYVLAAPEMGTTGIHWGNRFLLVLYPLLVCLSMVNVMRLLSETGSLQRLYLMVILVFVAVSVIWQVYSITLVAKKKDFNKRLSESVLQRPERVMVTNVWWAPQALSQVFYDRQIYYVPGQDAMQELGKRFVDTGTTAVLYITAAGDRAAPGGAIRVGDMGLRFFTLDLIPLTLQNNESQ